MIRNMRRETFQAELARKVQYINETLAELLQRQGGIHKGLKQAILYSLGAPGKRIRSAIVLWSCELIRGLINRPAQVAAAVIEMVHTYSLIHDDLPAMDNDDMRRGQPSCHKAFDEATAILTGDALLTVAFGILAREVEPADLAVRMIAELAEAAGPAGMIAGQMADLEAEKTTGNAQMLEYIHTNKTARMFQCSAVCGGLAGGADEQQLDALAEYGLKLGLAFQVADDILDVCGSSSQLGKTAGKDAKALKCTYPAVFGLEKSRLIEKQLANQAIDALGIFGAEAEILRQLPLVLLERSK